MEQAGPPRISEDIGDTPRTIKLLPVLSAGLAAAAAPPRRIDRERVIRTFNPRRTGSSDELPLQVGNGNFAFDADATGLQMFRPFATMSTWGWHSFPLPEKLSDRLIPAYFRGVEWPTHDWDVFYNIPNADQPLLSNRLRENPHRLNFVTLGLSFPDPDAAESDLTSASQTRWTGVLASSFEHQGSEVRVDTVADPHSNTVTMSVESSLLEGGELGLFLDLPYTARDKFDAPFVGLYNETDLHETEFVARGGGAGA